MELVESLTKQLEELTSELLKLEREFDLKKEQYLKVYSEAVEALYQLDLK